jgi:hypothetical protein
MHRRQTGPRKKFACRAAVAIVVHRGGGGGGVVAIAVPLVVPIPLVVSIEAPLEVLAPQGMQRKAVVIAESSQRRRGTGAKQKEDHHHRCEQLAGAGYKKNAVPSLKADSGGSECVSAALACRHITQTPRGGDAVQSTGIAPGTPPQGEAARRKGARLPAVGRQHRLRENAGSESDSLRRITEPT